MIESLDPSIGTARAAQRRTGAGNLAPVTYSQEIPHENAEPLQIPQSKFLMSGILHKAIETTNLV
jgi:hypothetical protein